ncbi:MAG: phosphatidylglycerophosphatase [Verrucomicrobiales bacterium]|nr:phosphatidylglycerophosphatase [Verrucomicrobiales bacterium]
MKKFDLRLWVALGFGSGKIPFGPGTFGSVVGLILSFSLLQLHSQAVFFLVLVALFFLSVYLSGYAEKILQKRDPGCVVIDEIVAIPCCWIATLLLLPHGAGTLPDWSSQRLDWWIKNGVTIFILFRIFDIVKPWPINRSQELARGWGVTVDDILAAGAVNVCMIAIYSWKLI